MADHTEVREIGIPVRAVRNGALFRGVGGDGDECLYAVMQQNGAGIGTFLLRIDLETGNTQRIDMPENLGNGPAIWSDRWRRLFAYVGVEFSNKGNLIQLDPKAGRFEDLGELPTAGWSEPVSLDEAADGTLYMGTYGGGPSLASYRPDAATFTDHGIVDADEFYFYVQCGADGTVAGLVKMARPHVVVFDPATGTLHPVGPVADTDAQQGHVNLAKGGDGLLYIDSHEGVFRIEGTSITPASEIPAVQPKALSDGSTFRFLDGRQDNIWLTRYRTVGIRKPDGAQRVLELDYEADGTPIYLVHAGTDGKVYGSSILPLHFFSYDPATDEMIHHGACSTASGEVYSMDCMDGKLYMCAYTHAILGEFDMSRPFSWGGPIPGKPGEFKQGVHGPNYSYTFDEHDNPRLLGRMDDVSYRARDMVAGPAGKVWTVAIPDYGMWGGVLSWYEPSTGTFGGQHRHIIENCSPISITHLADPDLLAIGFSMYGGSGTSPRTDKAGFALWDPNADRLVWKGDLGLDIVGVMDIEDAGSGLAYAIVHCCPEHVLKAELMLLDLRGERIVSRIDLTDQLGWPLEVSFQTDDRYLYGLTREGVYRVPLGTLDLEVLWRDKTNGPGPMIGAGALIDGVYYFGSDARLRSIKVS